MSMKRGTRDVNIPFHYTSFGLHYTEMNKIKLVLIILFPLILIGVIYLFVSSFSKKGYSDTAVVKQIRSLNRWETSSYSIEKIIDKGKTGNAIERVLFGNRILLIAHGEVVGGFDFSQLKDDSVKIDGKAITINFPPPAIISTSLNESETRVYDRQKGLLVGSDNNLESDAREEAVTAIRTAACSEGILNTTSENGRKQITSMLATFGFESITINIPQGSC